MTRKSKRELERAVADLTEDEAGDPMEVTITHTLVETSWSSDNPDPEPKPVSQTRAWRDEAGEWHSERIDLTDAEDAT